MSDAPEHPGKELLRIAEQKQKDDPIYGIKHVFTKDSPRTKMANKMEIIKTPKNRLMDEVKMNRGTISHHINGHRPISEHAAKKYEEAGYKTAEYWRQKQAEYDKYYKRGYWGGNVWSQRTVNENS